MFVISVLWMQRENVITHNLLYLLQLCKKFPHFNRILNMNNTC